MSSPACPRCTHTMTFVSESGGMPKLERYRCTPCCISASIELTYEYDDQPPDSPRLETPVVGVVPGSNLERQIQLARAEIAKWPDSVKRAMGIEP